MGFKKAKQLISGHIYDQLVITADKLIDHAIANYRSPIGPFTGNTITSYACGLYVDGVLTDIRLGGEKMRAPVHVKIQKGEILTLEEPYSGGKRTISGKADIVLGDEGMESSINFLTHYYKPQVRKGYEIVMCTGTEYSVYQENVWKSNFLTDTYKAASTGAFIKFKPLP